MCWVAAGLGVGLATDLIKWIDEVEVKGDVGDLIWICLPAAITAGVASLAREVVLLKVEGLAAVTEVIN